MCYKVFGSPDRQEDLMQEVNVEPERASRNFFILFAGVIMPAISISVEAVTHICAEEFFDPIPTPWHLALVVFVPLAQLQAWFAIRRGAPDRLKLAGLLNAAALGISLFYSLIYIPLFPLGALFLIIGVGLLPLAPFLSLLAAIVMRVQLKEIASKAPQQSFAVKRTGLLAGIGLAVLALCLIELPASLTRYGLQMATSRSPETRSEGIRFLRSFGSREYLLRSCYGRSGWATDLVGYLLSIQNPVEPLEARNIYYRVTGETFDTSIPPQRVGGRLLPQDEIDFDPDQGGVKIAGKVKGLSLASSKLDGTIDADGGVAYMQWTLVFQNDSDVAREARAEVQLPPGAVVSRLTLWVNGEEREAAFAGRAKVQEAYRNVVVVQRRDPVLVTTAGTDRVLVQCFPVPPNHGEMKIRFGITVPLILEARNDARLLIPYLASRNFRIPDHVGHALWFESQTSMSALNYDLRPDVIERYTPHGTYSLYGLRGAIQDTDLSKPDTTIRLNRAAAIGDIWGPDPFETGTVIKQHVRERVPPHLRRIVLVVDTSAALENDLPEILAAIRTLPSDFDVKMVLADADGFLDGTSPQNYVVHGTENIGTTLKSVNFRGGADNAPALSKAWELAAEAPGNNAIVWIHAPQLLHLQPLEGLKQRWERRPYGPLLYSLKTKPGSDEIETRLDGINEVKSVARLGSLQTDLEGLFARLTGQIPTLEFVRSSNKGESGEVSGTYRASDHLARLWANEEVSRFLGMRDDTFNEAAVALAVRYQLVTPVSGAVVLETKQQYDAAGLKPVDAGTVPTIPEPEMIALLAVVGLFLSWLIYRRMRTGAQGGCPV